MSRVMRHLLPAALLLAAGCGGDDYVAGIFLTIEQADRHPAQGYFIEVRHTDGRSFDGVSSTYQATTKGKQSVNLLFSSEALLDSGRSRKVRVYVEARETQNAPAFALGSQVTTVRRDQTVDVTVRLAGRPADLDGTVSATRVLSTGVGTPSSQVEVDLRGQALPAGHRLVAWQINDYGTATEQLVAMGTIQASSELLELSSASASLGIALSLEPSDSIDRPVRSSGWLTHRARWDDSVRDGYDTILGGAMAEVLRAAEVASSHAGFAQNSAGDTRLGHWEHTCRALFGASEPDCEHNENGREDHATGALSTHPGLGSSQLGGDVEAALGSIFENFDAAHSDPYSKSARDTAQLALQGCALVGQVDAAALILKTSALLDSADDDFAGQVVAAAQDVFDAATCLATDLPTWLLLPVEPVP